MMASCQSICALPLRQLVVLKLSNSDGCLFQKCSRYEVAKHDANILFVEPGLCLTEGEKIREAVRASQGRFRCVLTHELRVAAAAGGMAGLA